MSEEKRTTECGKKKKISGPGQKFASDEMKDAGETNLNDGKAPELDSSSKQDSVKATNEKTSSDGVEGMSASGKQQDAKGENDNVISKQKEEEDEEELRKEEEEVQQSLKEANEQVEQKLAMREKNLAALGRVPDESHFKGRDSSVKKNSAFIKKLRTITESQRESLEQEFAGLNLSRYVQEAVAAVLDGLTKLKLADVRCVSHMCGLIHQEYCDFCEPLKKGLMKMFDNYGGKEEEKQANVSKYRVTLRLLGELIISGVFPKLPEGIKMLQTILSNILNSDKESHVYVPVIISFARHCGEDFAGITSRKQRLLAEKHKVVFPKCHVVSAEDQVTINQLLQSYYKSLAGHLMRAHKDVQNREKQNRQTLMLQDLPFEKKINDSDNGNNSDSDGNSHGQNCNVTIAIISRILLVY